MELFLYHLCLYKFDLIFENRITYLEIIRGSHSYFIFRDMRMDDDDDDDDDETVSTFHFIVFYHANF